MQQAKEKSKTHRNLQSTLLPKLGKLPKQLSSIGRNIKIAANSSAENNGQGLKKASHLTNKKGAYYDESAGQNSSNGNYYMGSSADKKNNPLRQSMPLENLQKIKELYELPSPKAAAKKSKF